MVVESVQTEATPRTIRVAGLLTTLEGVAGLVFVVALVVRAVTSEGPGGVGSFTIVQTYGEAAYYLALSAAVLAAGIGLLRGKFWARTPAMLLQLLLLGAAWYAIGPSGRPLIGFVIAAPAAAVLWFMFNRAGRAWAFSANTAPDAD